MFLANAKARYPAENWAASAWMSSVNLKNLRFRKNEDIDFSLEFSKSELFENWQRTAEGGSVAEREDETHAEKGEGEGLATEVNVDDGCK